jgi:hypothetical protein
MTIAKQKPELEVRMSATLGDGGMNFRKVEVSLSMPCDSAEEVEETYNAVKGFVKDNLNEAIGELITENPAFGVVEPAVASADLDDEL